MTMHQLPVDTAVTVRLAYDPPGFISYFQYWNRPMEEPQRFRLFGLAAVAAILVLGPQAIRLEAQVGDPATLDQEKLVAQIKLTKAAADHSDIVTAGDIVVLHKDGLMMCSSASSYAFSNTYSNGVLAANYNNRAKDAAKSFSKGHDFPSAAAGAPPTLPITAVPRASLSPARSSGSPASPCRRTASWSARSATPTTTFVSTERSSFTFQKAACRRQTNLSKPFPK